MAENLFVQLVDSEEADHLQWLLLDESSGVVRTRGQGTSQDLKAFVEASAWSGENIVLVPAEQVLMTSAQVPSRKTRQIIQALPFAIEEQLTENVELMHLSMGGRADSGEIAVAVVARDVMAHWVEVLEQSGLNPQFMVSDALCVSDGTPINNETVNILLESERVLFRVGVTDGFAVEKEQVSTFLSVLNHSHDKSEEILETRQFTLFSAQSEDQQVLIAQWQAELEGALNQQPLDYEPFETLCRGFSARTAINLLTGEFAPQSSSSSSKASWRSVAALLVIGFLLHIMSLVGQGVYLNIEANAFREDAQQLYANVYPDDRNVRDLRRRWRSHLNGDSSSEQQDDFMSVFSAATAELKNTSLQLVNINFNQQRGDLILQLVAPNSDQLVSYSQKLATAGLKSEIGTINQDDNSVKGSIRIRGFQGAGS
jgi:general secretion pathway protein L